MRSHRVEKRWVRCTACSLVFAAASVLVAGATAQAGQRQYLVILATSPKQHGNNPAGLPNPQTIENQYFHGPDSFAEYWREVSYGDVTIDGAVTDWLNLPWRVRPLAGSTTGARLTFYNLKVSGPYLYGVGEPFNTQRAMVRVDIDGDPNAAENGPYNVDQNPAYATGAKLTTAAGAPVWTPGERFLDMDGDGRWDGFDEARNEMDWNNDGRPDNLGPWYDLNDNGVPENANDCVYLRDSDNDGNPDCCPNGPGTPGCLGILATTVDARAAACRSTSWTGPGDRAIIDCNGNLIPDDDDIRDGRSRDRLPYTTQGAACLAGGGDGIPDECQYVDPDVPCVATRPSSCEGGNENPDPCCSVPAICATLPVAANRNPVVRCEYDDANNNNRLDIVEPFENSITRAKLVSLERRDDPDFCRNKLSETYLRDNFPGNAAAKTTLVVRGGVRVLYGAHDPSGKVTARCTCTDGTNCITIPSQPGPPVVPALLNACPAGEHAQYDPPDEWMNRAEGPKMRIDRRLLEEYTTPKPPWYEQAWRDRYGTEPPPWDSRTIAAVPMATTGAGARREFIADRGGVGGRGSGWVGCSDSADRRVVFATGLCAEGSSFDTLCDRRILPEETAGIGGNIISYDGWVEFDDLPSSKYHVAGDQGFGEVTSPFSTNIWGQDRGVNSPNAGGGPDFIIPAAGPYAKNLHGNFGRDGGNVLQMEYLTARRNRVCSGGSSRGTGCSADFACSGGVNDGASCTNSADCPGGTCIDSCPGGSCNGGANDGAFCADSTSCPGGNCVDASCQFFPDNGLAWFATQSVLTGSYRPHEYASPAPVGLGLGFRDYNLDGLVDLGESVPPGAENYVVDPKGQGIPGTETLYPWNRKRLLEDSIEILDDVIDFDDYVDPVAMDRITCGAGNILRVAPPPFQDQNGDGVWDFFPVAGIQSGIVLLPAGTVQTGDFRGATGFFDPLLFPIHTEDGIGDPAFANAAFPQGPYVQSTNDRLRRAQQLSLHLLFHDLVFDVAAAGAGGSVGASGGQTAYSAHEYLHTWESFPDLYDYDIYDTPPGRENCHVGRWDIMANGGLVHPTPILKASACTEWIEPVDLTSVLTPGVDKVITLPPAELVRDNSYYYLSNEDRPGEQFWFWSAGSGFDALRPGGGMPGAGVLIMHTDLDASNPDALPQQQRSGDRPHYAIIQADGNGDLLDCTNRGDAGDPFPGITGQTSFDCETVPASEWYTDSACTGLDIRSITLDGNGAATVIFNWTPTTIPGLRFIDPPGGVSVGSPPNAVYNVRAEANDVFGGTRIRFFYTTSESTVPDPAASTSHPISLIQKTTPGFREVSLNWNVSTLPDGRYYLFADLIPGTASDGTERKLTDPRPGRNNVGTATLQVLPADVLTSTLNAAGNQVAVQGKARSETWTMRCINATTGEWVVNSSLTLPAPKPGAVNQDPYPHATTGTKYVSAAGGVSFTIQAGASGATKGAVGDTFTFTTTGLTARSEGVTIRNGRISEDPVAVVDATPLSGLPPLTVSFDARRSTDPNGAPLTYRWTFGDGSAQVTGSQPQHEYRDAGTFTATLRATNAGNGRFGEASVDIRVINNSPSAQLRATPNSGIAPLVVHFSASQSSDAETPPEQLIYQWEFGDGTSANDARVAGLSFREVDHTYSRRADGTQCSLTAPCSFTAMLTVTDRGGATDTDSTVIRIGNTNPVPNISFSPLVGPTPLMVVFNAKNSTDAESDPIEVEWIWGDGTANETYRATTGKPPTTDGGVAHTFTLPAGQTTRSFTVRAILRDLTAAGVRKGGESTWAGVTVTVNTLVPDTNRPPTARFTVTPIEGIVGELIAFDASASTDADGDNLRFQWDFGDGDSTQLGATPTATHAYDEAGTYTVRLTVHDVEDATAVATQVVRILAEGTNRSPVAIIATGPRTGPAPLGQTFDGRLSFDPDLEALAYTWEVRSGDLLIDTLTGSVATRMFDTEGTFTVTLTVTDVRGASDTSDPVTVVVAGQAPPPNDDTEPPRPGPTEPPNSANQRPAPFVCGLGMLGALFATVAGLGLTSVLRRRRTR